MILLVRHRRPAVHSCFSWLQLQRVLLSGIKNGHIGTNSTKNNNKAKNYWPLAPPPQHEWIKFAKVSAVITFDSTEENQTWTKNPTHEMRSKNNAAPRNIYCI